MGLNLKLVAAAVLCLATAIGGALAQDQSQSQPKTAAPPLVAPLVWLQVMFELCPEVLKFLGVFIANHDVLCREAMP
jgi:hypothetical protein